MALSLFGRGGPASLTGFGDDFFQPFFTSDPFRALTTPAPGGGELATRGMPLDVAEKENSFEVAADIPGARKEDIKVTVDNDVLRINVEKSEEKKEDKEEQGVKYHRYERSSQFVGRALRMPDTANLDQIQAKYDNGVLRLEIPKREQAKEQTKRITVS